MICRIEDAPPCLRHFICSDLQDWYLRSDKRELKSFSPFFGSSKWNTKTFYASDCYDVVQSRGMDIDFVNSLCAWFGVSPVDARGGEDFITDAWMRVCAECPLMSHLVPQSIKDRDDAGGMIRFLWMSDILWGQHELLLCVRALAASFGYTSVESRVVVRNEYDDQSYSERDVEVCFLMKESDKRGFGGKEIFEDGECDPFHVMVARACTLRDANSMSSYGSWRYDIGSDTIMGDNLAVGMDVGREIEP
jgi:hypothetical protein